MLVINIRSLYFDRAAKWKCSEARRDSKVLARWEELKCLMQQHIMPILHYGEFGMNRGGLDKCSAVDNDTLMKHLQKRRLQA